jgi:hypothetical protein
MSLYAEMLAAGLVVGNHSSDLYTLDTPKAWEIFEKYKDSMSRPQRFVSNTGEGRCLDFAFCYTPFWDEINNKVLKIQQARGLAITPPL